MKVQISLTMETELDLETYPAGLSLQEMVKLELDNDAALFFDNCVLNEKSIQVEEILSPKIMEAIQSGIDKANKKKQEEKIKWGNSPVVEGSTMLGLGFR